MPIVASAAAFDRLVAARSHLNEIEKLINDIEPDKDRQSMARYRQLQTEWDTAFSELETATQEFSTAVSEARKDLENHVPEPSARRVTP
jgi:uncharacterized protein YukE